MSATRCTSARTGCATSKRQSSPAGLERHPRRAVSPRPDAGSPAPDAGSPAPYAGNATQGEPGDRHFVTALARGLQLLRCFRSGEELLGNQQLAQRCSLPKPTVTRLGYLRHGTQLGLTAAGRACLASMDATHRRPLVARLQALDAAGRPAVERGVRQAQAEPAELGCCGSFGDWKPEIHGIAVPLALGNGLPDRVLSAAGPAVSRSAASYLAEVRPLLIDAVQHIRGQLGR